VPPCRCLHCAGHPNVVQVVHALEDHTHVHIIMELCSGGDLVSQKTAARHAVDASAIHASQLTCTIVTYIVPEEEQAPVAQHRHAEGVVEVARMEASKARRPCLCC
jgi:hypothetical protein